MLDVFSKKKVPFIFLRKDEGFTIIELLSVIAIIGILMGIVLVSSGDSRDKGRDASIKMAIVETAKAAELLYGNTASYNGVCNPPNKELSKYGDFGMIRTYIEDIGGVTVCKDNDDAYAAMSSMHQGNCWCVDSSGNSKEIVLGAGQDCDDVLLTTSCP